ncbi:hypothetical protein AB0467_30100 [Streptomyces sp. NPDC052095]|uniref:hypothetical protein n=1 Tax=unclassified Streptomyces TaxID=2593676 RepID=UPI0034501E11
MSQWDAEEQRWVPGSSPAAGSGEPPPDSDLSRVLIVAALVVLLLAVAGTAVWVRSGDDGAGGGGTVLTTPSGPPPTTFGDDFPGTADPYGSDTYGSDPPAQEEAPPTPDGPADTVRSYYGAINSGDYDTAWELGGKNLTRSFSAFTSGFANTASDDVQVTDTVGDTVHVDITAHQTDGSRQTYTGTYTVLDGTITSARIRRTG